MRGRLSKDAASWSPARARQRENWAGERSHLEQTEVADAQVAEQLVAVVQQHVAEEEVLLVRLDLQGFPDEHLDVDDLGGVGRNPQDQVVAVQLLHVDDNGLVLVREVVVVLRVGDAAAAGGSLRRGLGGVRLDCVRLGLSLIHI